MAAAGAYPPELPCMRGMWNPSASCMSVPAPPGPLLCLSSPLERMTSSSSFPPPAPCTTTPRLLGTEGAGGTSECGPASRLGLLIPFRVPIHTVGELCVSHHLPAGRTVPLKSDIPALWFTCLVLIPRAGLELCPGRSPVNGTSQQSVFSPHVPSTVGTPIPVQRSPKPSREPVDQLHELQVELLTQLFEKHKMRYGVPADQHLVLI